MCRNFFDKALKKIEIERRMRLLQQDSELAKLFKQFVIGGILTEAEFWATRKKLLDGDNNRSSKQHMGLKSAMTSVIKPVADGQTNKVTYNVTPEIIHQDHGISCDGIKEVAESQSHYDQYKRKLLQDVSRHAAVVLEGWSIDVELGDTRTVAKALARSRRVELANEGLYTNFNQEQLNRIFRMIEIKDLQAPHEPPLAPLCIRVCFSS